MDILPARRLALASVFAPSPTFRRPQTSPAFSPGPSERLASITEECSPPKTEFEGPVQLNRAPQCLQCVAVAKANQFFFLHDWQSIPRNPSPSGTVPFPAQLMQGLPSCRASISMPLRVTEGRLAWYFPVPLQLEQVFISFPL